MIISCTAPAGLITPARERFKVSLTPGRSGSSILTLSVEGTDLGPQEWMARQCRILYAAPWERKLFPPWLRFDAPPTEVIERLHTAPVTAMETAEFRISTQTKGGLLVVSASGLSTPENASGLSSTVGMCEALTPGRLGLLVDVSRLDHWQDMPNLHQHMVGYPLSSEYATRRAIVDTRGIDLTAARLHEAGIARHGFVVRHFTTHADALDYLHSLKDTGVEP